jgi:hypothetical protein
LTLEPNQSYVILKLVSGEQLMGVRTEETETDITVMFPMTLRQYPVQREDGTVGETITGGPFCQFATDRTFTIPKAAVMFNKPLHEMLVPFYVRMVNQYERMIEVPQSMFMNEEEEQEAITVEDVEKAVDRLAAIMYGDKKHSEEKEVDGYFIEGNDTIH